MRINLQQAAGTVKPIILPLRILFKVATALAFIAGIQLYILTDHTDHFFAWTIAQPLSATLLGTGYLSGCALLILAVREPMWAQIRVAVAAIVAFVPVLVVVTYHLNNAG